MYSYEKLYFTVFAVTGYIKSVAAAMVSDILIPMGAHPTLLIARMDMDTSDEKQRSDR